jgi:hypothetical protein
MLDQVSAQLVEQAQMAALPDQEIINGPQHRAEAVRITDQPVMTIGAGAIAQGLRFQHTLEQPSPIDLLQHAQRRAGEALRLDMLGPGTITRANAPKGPDAPQQRERITMAPFDQG